MITLSRRLRNLSASRLGYFLLAVISISIFFFIFTDSEEEYSDEWHNYVPSTSQFDLLKAARVERSLNITIVIVIEENTDLSDYAIALNTMECYALQHKYPLKIVRDSEYQQCSQNDMMFRRHCVVAEILKKVDYVLFIDADMAVVNPKRLIEEYIDSRFDITFYDRFYNWEVAAGSYIVKNTEWGIKFLQKFADYENQLPHSFHGTDNGALHAYLAEYLYPDLRDEIQVCLRIWEKSTGYATLFLFEGCLRAVIGSRADHEHVRIYKKGRGWVRDIWLTDSRWSEQGDFMLHALQERRQIQLPHNWFGYIREIGKDHLAWYNPLKKRLDITACGEGRPNWEHEEELKVSKQEIDKRLAKIARQVEKDRWRMLIKVANYV